ncbi:hypothetical protein [Pleionea sediminis]|uniref:hypothetical protein n=1 Tax=Pleionea sediminis TaxID=2569479 RepID=UPI00118619F8|nr:hypothetical protein [Pleionea sediminis]
MNIIQYCINEHFPTGSEEYYAMLYLKNNTDIWTQLALVDAISNSRIQSSEPDVYQAKLQWWLHAIQQQESSHPLLNFLAPLDTNIVIELIMSLIFELLKCSSHDKLLLNDSLVNILGKSLLAILNNHAIPSQNEKEQLIPVSKFLGQYWIIKRCILNHQLAALSHESITSFLTFPIHKSQVKLSQLPAKIFFQFAYDWRKLNKRCIEEQRFYELSGIRKLWTSWKIKTFQSDIFTE